MSKRLTYIPLFTPAANPETLIVIPISWVWRLRLRELKNLPGV